MFKSDLFMVARLDDTRWQLSVPLVYKGNRDTFTVPAGHVTDFASVPRMLQWFAPSTGKYTLAAVLHDYLCDSLVNGYAGVPGGQGVEWDGQPVAVITSRDVDGLFRRVMREQHVLPALRWFMWAGVRWGAVFNRRRRPGVLRDMPLVLLLTVLALPLVLPATLCIWFAYAVQFVYEGFAGWFDNPEKD